MQINKRKQFYSHIAFSLALLLILKSHAAAAGGDNRYCGPGNVPSFGASDGPASLPQSCFYTAMSATPSPNPPTTVPAGTLTQLNTAINNAKCGDTIELPAGAVYSGGNGGNLSLPPKNCDNQHWITIQSNALASLPPEGTRISPCYSNVASLPGRPAYNCPAGGPTPLMPTIILGSQGSVNITGDHYRLIGLEITQNVGQLIFQLVTTAGSSQIIMDRLWIHGRPTDDTAHGVTLDDVNHVAIIDSYFSDIHCVNGAVCNDAQAISGGLDSLTPGFAGTYKIVNNFMEASTENFIFGGGHSVDVPADFEIRRNHMFRPVIRNVGNLQTLSRVGGVVVAQSNVFNFT